MLNPWTQDHARAVQGVRARDYASDFARESALRVWRSHWNLFLKGMSLVGLVSFGNLQFVVVWEHFGIFLMVI